MFNKVHGVSVHLLKNCFQGVLFFIDVESVLFVILYIRWKMRNSFQVAGFILLMLGILVGDSLLDAWKGHRCVGFGYWVKSLVFCQTEVDHYNKIITNFTSANNLQIICPKDRAQTFKITSINYPFQKIIICNLLLSE